MTLADLTHLLQLIIVLCLCRLTYISGHRGYNIIHINYNML